MTIELFTESEDRFVIRTIKVRDVSPKKKPKSVRTILLPQDYFKLFGEVKQFNCLFNKIIVFVPEDIIVDRQKYTEAMLALESALMTPKENQETIEQVPPITQEGL